MRNIFLEIMKEFAECNKRKEEEEEKLLKNAFARINFLIKSKFSFVLWLEKYFH